MGVPANSILYGFKSQEIFQTLAEIHWLKFLPGFLIAKKCHCIYKFYDKFITCMYRAGCILRMLLGLYQDRRLYLHMSLKTVWVFCVYLIV